MCIEQEFHQLLKVIACICCENGMLCFKLTDCLVFHQGLYCFLRECHVLKVFPRNHRELFRELRLQDVPYSCILHWILLGVYSIGQYTRRVYDLRHRLQVTRMYRVMIGNNRLFSSHLLVLFRVHNVLWSRSFRCGRSISLLLLFKHQLPFFL